MKPITQAIREERRKAADDRQAAYNALSGQRRQKEGIMKKTHLSTPVVYLLGVSNVVFTHAYHFNFWNGLIVSCVGLAFAHLIRSFDKS